MKLTVLVFEGRIADGWTPLGIQTAAMPPATISNNTDDGRRDIYVTQCFEDHATIHKLRGGIDFETGVVRVISAAELENSDLVRRLAIGEHIELELKPDRAPKRMAVRYRCAVL